MNRGIVNKIKVLLLFAVVFQVNGFQAKNLYAADDEDSEYNFSWLDPDKKIYVLQNRKYRKAKRISLYANLGLNLSSPFKTGYIMSPRASYFITEQWGIEGLYSFLRNVDNDTMDAMRKVSASALPFVREVKNYYGLLATWNPWYAKMNFFNNILYLDWNFHAGLGRVNTSVDLNNKASGTSNIKNETFMAYFLGTSQKYYISKAWCARVDLLGMFYRANGADNETKLTYRHFDFTFGVGYTF